MTNYSLNDRWQENRSTWKEYWNSFTLDNFAIALIVFAVVIVGFGYFNQHGGAISWTNIFGDFYANVSSELISIVITVLVLERLNNRRQDKQELTRLKALLGSNEAVVTKIAVAELRAREWFKDGSLAGSNLCGLNLVGTDLSYANLKDTNLSGVDLQSAYLNISYLVGANLDHANLKKIMIMNTNLAGANLERVNFASARLSMVNLTGAHLKYAIFRDSKLFFTILPDGTACSKNEDMQRFTNPRHPEYLKTLEKINKIRKESNYPIFNKS